MTWLGLGLALLSGQKESPAAGLCLFLAAAPRPSSLWLIGRRSTRPQKALCCRSDGPKIKLGLQKSRLISSTSRLHSRTWQLGSACRTRSEKACKSTTCSPPSDLGSTLHGPGPCHPSPALAPRCQLALSYGRGPGRRPAPQWWAHQPDQPRSKRPISSADHASPFTSLCNLDLRDAS